MCCPVLPSLQQVTFPASDLLCYIFRKSSAHLAFHLIFSPHCRRKPRAFTSWLQYIRLLMSSIHCHLVRLYAV
jgi:hypothetical protein